MGLDNEFRLRSDKDATLDVGFIDFSRFEELDTYIRHYCDRMFEGDEHYRVDVEDLRDLKRHMEKPASKILRLNDNHLEYYEDHGYPEDWHIELYGNDFSPVMANSSYFGFKLRRLYFAVNTMIEVLESNNNGYTESCNKGYFFLFISSR